MGDPDYDLLIKQRKENYPVRDEHSSLRDRYLRDYHGYEDVAAIAFARDLMQGDPATFKAGYTRENAILAAQEMFPEAMVVDWESEL